MILQLALYLSLPVISMAQTSSSEHLLKAAKQGDTTAVRSLIARGANIETTDEYSRTALMLAAQAGHAETVRLMLQLGARVDTKNELGATPLMLASLNGHFEVVRILVDKGANVNTQSSSGLTALMLSVVRHERSSLDIANLLIEHHADVNLADEIGWTALMHAVHSPPPPPPPFGSDKALDQRFTEVQTQRTIQKKMVYVLIKAGSNLNAKDRDGNTVLTLAESCKQRELVKTLTAASQK